MFGDGVLLGRGAQVLGDRRACGRPRSATPAGFTPNPTYEEVCSGRTGHTEVVLVVFDPSVVTYERAAEGVLGEPRPDPGHAPGQRRRHAVPLGDLHVRRRAARGGGAVAGRRTRRSSTEAGYGEITTEIRPAPTFYFAEDYHQQYLAKNPSGYCGIGGTGVSCRRLATGTRSPRSRPDPASRRRLLSAWAPSTGMTHARTRRSRHAESRCGR